MIMLQLYVTSLFNLSLQIFCFFSCFLSPSHPAPSLRLLNYAKKGESIRRQDFFTVVAYVGRNPAASALVWDWARDNYQAFIDRSVINKV